ncbi:MAG: hypothetical protein H6R18_742 [Proteobacteria bacterium]|nr:hypothetical protein [Pseudomonadota bacterium]
MSQEEYTTTRSSKLAADGIKVQRLLHEMCAEAKDHSEIYAALAEFFSEFGEVRKIPAFIPMGKSAISWSILLPLRLQ